MFQSIWAFRRALLRLTLFARHLSSSPWPLVAELTLVIVGATTFVSHTVAALVLMPLVVDLGADAGVERQAVLLAAFACSTACALPMTSFPNVSRPGTAPFKGGEVNSLMAVDDLGKPWLSVRNFLVAAGLKMREERLVRGWYTHYGRLIASTYHRRQGVFAYSKGFQDAEALFRLRHEWLGLELTK